MNERDLQSRSPWSTLNEYRAVSVSPAKSKRIDGEVSVPGSKSFTNRALLMAALASGTSRISGVLKSDDSYWCIQALKDLGLKISTESEQTIVDGISGEWPVRNGHLYVGAAGTVARFLPGLLAASRNGDWVLEASASMSQRPMKPLLDILQELGANISYLGEQGFFPIRIVSNGLEGGEIHLSGKISSQFISGLLIASCYAKSAVTIHIEDNIVQHLYVLITLDLLSQFGANLAYDKSLKKIVITPARLKAKDLLLEPDVSTACYFMALAALTKGRIRIKDLKLETNQPDIKVLSILERMGCKVRVGLTWVEVHGPEKLHGGFDVSMKEMSDQALTIAAIAPFADGPIGINEVQHIRSHESDRIASICSSLSKAGIRTEERPDGFTVHPGIPNPVVFDSFDDHRVAMSLSLMGSVVNGIKVKDPGCVSKTFPQFYTELKRLGLDIELIK